MLIMLKAWAWENWRKMVVWVHVSDPLSTLTLWEPKTPGKLEESGGRALRPGLSQHSERETQLIGTSCSYGDLKAMARQRGVQQLEVDPSAVKAWNYFRGVLHLPNCSMGSRGTAHSWWPWESWVQLCHVLGWRGLSLASLSERLSHVAVCSLWTYQLDATQNTSTSWPAQGLKKQP